MLPGEYPNQTASFKEPAEGVSAKTWASTACAEQTGQRRQTNNDEIGNP